MSNNTVKKSNRMNIGSVVINKDPKKADYIQIRKDLKEPLVLNAGDYLSVETIKFQLESLDRAVSEGKLSEDYADKQREYINAGVEKRKQLANGKDFVRADVFVSRKQ